MQIIDLRIYALEDYKQGVYRFYSDQDDTPAIMGLQAGENLFKATAMYIDDAYVYIADPTKQRVLVFTKGQESLQFVNQYVYRGDKENGFKNITEIFVNQTNKRMYVLDGDGLYKISIN